LEVRFWKEGHPAVDLAVAVAEAVDHAIENLKLQSYEKSIIPSSRILCHFAQ